MARKAGELKKRCWLAKQRLKMGYWDSVKADGGAPVEAQERRVDITRQIRVADVAEKTVSPRDEKLYGIVCEMLDSNEVTLNPIGRLIERDVYDSLDPASRQRYILELSEKFRELQERYYKEKTGA